MNYDDAEKLGRIFAAILYARELSADRAKILIDDSARLRETLKNAVEVIAQEIEK
jgi:S-adenosylmethionine/arginine decarboxylase-like enzyme